MTATPDWGRVKEVFHRAVDVAPADRPAFLDEACGGDAPLRLEVQSLLAAHEDTGNLLETSVFSGNGGLLGPGADGASPAPIEDELEGHRVGTYRVVQRIGSGGMGTVYRAVRADAAFDKQVAIKVIKRGMDTDDTLRRFQDERQTLARLDHPNIARLIDGGSTGDGRPFLVMEYVEGLAIDEYCDAERVSLRNRVRLFRTVCQAVQHAHQNLVIHRDLKPDNILVDAAGSPKLLDFGIAKVLAPSPSEAPAPTSLVERRMTLAYSSPEQVRGEPMTTASDVYSLGVILYELLTGQRPYRRAVTTAVAYEHALSEPVPLPSTRVREGGSTPEGAAIAAARQTTTSALARELSGDLDTIVLKAIQPGTSRRYVSVQQLGEDIERYLTGLPVLARADSVTYRAAKFVRRHRAGVAALIVLGVALAVGVAGTLWQARVAAGERDRAALEARKAQVITSFLVDVLGSADPRSRGREATVAEVLDEAAQRAERELAGQPEQLEAMRATIGATQVRRGRAAEALPLLKKALDQRERRLGPDHPDVAELLQELGEAYAGIGDAATAEPILRRAVDIRRRTAGPESAPAASALDSLGSLYTQEGKLAEAVETQRSALAIRRKVLGNEHPDVVHSLNNLAVPLGTLGRWEEALPLHQEALALVLKVRGPEHPDAAAAMTTLAYAFESVGRYPEALDYYGKALPLRRKTLGADHPEAAWTAYNYAALLQARGQHARALQLADEVLALRGKTLQDNHPLIPAILQVRGLVLAALGRAAEGEASLRDSLAVRSRSLPASHWLIASSRSLLGEHLVRYARRFAEAEPLLRGGYEGLRAALGPQDPRTRAALTRLVALYDAWDRPSAAGPYRRLLST
ncbi:MAG: serine/threonine-protein kinase, partial [Vicinamibacteraceae bacterium]